MFPPDLFTANASRPLPFKLRGDLQWEHQTQAGKLVWVIKDPWRKKYFCFEEHEYFLLQQLHNTISLLELQQAFETRFAPQKITVKELYRLLGMAHSAGLLLSNATGQGRVLWERRSKQHKQEQWKTVTNLLSIRFRGIDPHALLQKITPYCRWIFSPTLLFLAVSLASFTSLFVLMEWNQFLRKLPEAQQFFGWQNWFWLGLTLGLLKILHELGHAIACYVYGSECHEMGLLLLCGTPCLYCDVTDSWMLPSKWQRAAIGAAGMYVELWIALCATWVWWYSEPGWLHHLALNVIFVGSVSTLMFNANPLMKYDGYYILSDLLEVSNLRSKADIVLQHFLKTIFTKSTQKPRFSTKNAWLLAMYAIAAKVYSWFVTASILIFLYWLTEPLGYKIIGQILATLALGLLLGVPLWKSVSHLFTAGERGMSLRFKRAPLALALLLFLGLLFLPLPYYMRCAVRVQPQNAAGVYLNVPGTIEKIYVATGDEVRAGQPLLKLRNVDLELSIAQLETECAAQLGQLASLRHLAATNANAREQLTSQTELLETLQQELQQRREQQTQLMVVAPCNGTVLAAPRRPSATNKTEYLPAWTGHALEQRNVGATLSPNDLICSIGELNAWDALLAVDLHDMPLVTPGTQVDILLTQQTGQRIATKISAVAAREMQFSSAPQTQTAGGELLTKADAQGRQRPMFVTYEALARFTASPHDLVSQGSGIARIHGGYRSPAYRLGLQLARMFHFQM